MPDSDSSLVKARRQKLERLRARGIDPYPHRYDRTSTSVQAAQLLAQQEDSQGAEARTEPVSIAGRLTGFRSMGKATFADILDGVGQIQALFRRNVLDESYDTLKDLDLGDWVGVTGPVFRTRAGEATVEVHEYEILSKALRPLPEKWHGLVDVETRYRQRYLDLISNREARDIAAARSRCISSLRRFMEDRDFIEVETPILVPVAGGTMARPFITHHNALDRDLYLRIAIELYLKRLIVGGFEKVFEVGRVFRNEGVDFYHNPEFTMMESYEAYADYEDVMRMVEELMHKVALDVLGQPTVEFEGNVIDFTPPWPRLSLREEVKRRSGVDFLECPDIDSLRHAIQAAGLSLGEQVSWGGQLDKLISSAVEPHLVQPTFLVDYPVEMSPLAKRKRGDERLVERFEGFIAGMEICNAFTELNDPIDQRERFEEQEKLRSAFGAEDFDRLDEDFLLAIEYGMPPTGGLGLGVDRLAMLISGKRSIREVVLFPQLRTR